MPSDASYLPRLREALTELAIFNDKFHTFEGIDGF